MGMRMGRNTVGIGVSRDEVWATYGVERKGRRSCTTRMAVPVRNTTILASTRLDSSITQEWSVTAI